MAAQIMASEGDYVTVKLPSGELRLIHGDCYATIGQVGNPDHMNVLLGKAGRNRWLGRRGISRGMARNPVDHPMGGGQGKSKGGGGWHHPVFAVGQTGEGRQDAPQEEVFERIHFGTKEEINGTFAEKRSVC